MGGWRDLSTCPCLFCGDTGPHRYVGGPKRSLRVINGPSKGLQVWRSLERASLRCARCCFIWHEIVKEMTAV